MAKKPTYEELVARNAELEEAIEHKSQISFKVSEKGGVSIYGLGRFPVTLYYEQWSRLIAEVPALQKFIKDHKGNLKMKGEKNGA